jgi:hypothetical protein
VIQDFGNDAQDQIFGVVFRTDVDRMYLVGVNEQEIAFLQKISVAAGMEGSATAGYIQHLDVGMPVRRAMIAQPFRIE